MKKLHFKNKDFSFYSNKDMRGTNKEISHSITFLDLFDEIVQKYPDTIACVFDNERITYAELHTQVNQCANKILSKLNSEPSHSKPIVGLYCQRNLQMLIGILAIFRAGCVYLPLEPNLPKERLHFIIEDSGTHLILCEDKNSLLVNDLSYPFLIINSKKKESKALVSKVHIRQEDLAYIIYTSGSTGQPKGVKVSHRNLLNFLISMKQILNSKETDSFLAITSISFDISLLELLLPLTCAATIEVLPKKTLTNSQKLVENINRICPTWLQATPSTLSLIKMTSMSLTPLSILVGGEKIDPSLADYFLKQGHRLFNMYGPTETTIWSSCQEILDSSRISIAYPVLNTQFYIVNKNNNLCIPGEIGELWISGDGVSPGYLNRPHIKSFTQNPFFEESQVYKTGDLVKYHNLGYLEFCGRADQQVKIRGYRIELDEVKLAIKNQVKEEVFVVIRNIPSPHLFAFIVSAKTLDTQIILGQISKVLPSYMVPEGILVLKEIPLTSSNKVNLSLLKTATVNEILKQYGHSHSSSSPQQGNLKEDILKEIKNLIYSKFGIEIERYDDELGFYGFNSITFNELALELNKKYLLSLFTPSIFYSLSSLNKITNFIETQKLDADKIKNTHCPLNSSFETSSFSETVAIIGFDGFLPGSQDLNEFWQNLLHQIEAIKPLHRWDNTSQDKAGILNEIQEFDAPFFNISPLEAQSMDPQQRLLLQTTWKTIENAGYDPLSLKKHKIGVFIGNINSGYWDLQQTQGAEISPYSLSGQAHSLLANRLSFYFDWKGQSKSIDTSCSSSLIACGMAFNALINKTCNMTLVGGVNLILSPTIHESLKRNQMLSPRHACRTFDAGADGYVRGEGVGCVLLKRYSDAVRDKDFIHGVILACEENHGGRSHSLTAPNPEAQTDLLIESYKSIDIKTISYIETHGTGTKLGDPIEVDALKKAWGVLSKGEALPLNTVGLGSVKTHIGHLEPAAGIASLLKVLLCLKHKQLPGNLHFETLNPYIQLGESPFYVLKEAQPWLASFPRRAGISSFGFGGSNAHLVIEEAPSLTQPENHGKDAYFLIALSAKNEASLEEMQKNLATFLKEEIPNEYPYTLENIAYTLNCGRSHFNCRRVFIVQNIKDLQEQLDQKDYGLSVSSNPENNILVELAKAYLDNQDVDFKSLHKNHTQQKIPLPTYHFSHNPYWFKRTNKENIKWEFKENEVIIEISSDHIWLKDHQVEGMATLPGVAYIVLVKKAYEYTQKSVSGFCEFQEISWVKPLVVIEGTSVQIKITLDALSQVTKYQIFYKETLYSEGKIKYVSSPSYTLSLPSIESFKNNSHEVYDKPFLYDCFNKNGINYGPSFQNLKKIWVGKDMCLAELQTTFSVKIDQNPPLLDSAFQTILGLKISSLQGPLLPFSAGGFYFSEEISAFDHFFVYVKAISPFRSNLFIFSPQGSLLVAVIDLGLMGLKKASIQKITRESV
ncbi:MAG: amino acid adenylation domain-containing protein [Silvanigrellaceae bacterium]|nr:amino acid adenylation domain-containing protein [Silvanigrellaceae bacterium]